MRVLAINDTHIAVNRSGGTTRDSLAALREYTHQVHRNLLQLAVTHGCETVLVNGDLTDSFDIPLSEALTMFETADEFLSSNPDKNLVWALGNHSLSKDSSRMGAEQFIGALLTSRYQARFTLVARPTLISEGVYVIPHLANQDLWELEVSRIPVGVHTVFLHVNWDNSHAMQADHSLNLSRDLAKELKAKGIRMVLGHEHQQSESLGGSVVVVGNQAPTSVADCLGSTGKRALILDGTDVSFIQTWTPDSEDGWYAEVDWRELKDVVEEGRGFIRVVGDASAAESSEAIKAIAAFRQRSKSFVITNAVKVEQVEGMEDIAESIEDIRTVNVISILMEMLDPPQRAKVEELMEGEQE